MVQKSAKKILVVCVDRDNDLGRKAGIVGPIIGRAQNLNAAAKLAVADPGESDANSIFGAVKKYDGVKEHYENVEIVTLTGHSKKGFESDKEINEQLDVVMGRFSAEAIVLVSDGAEDDQVLPILQSRAQVMSKETIIVKQASQVESTFYTIKEALRDPFAMLLVFGVPGVIILLVSVLPEYGWQVAGGALGVFFILYGFGVYDRAVTMGRGLSELISLQRTSFIFYIAMILVFIFGPVSAYNLYLLSGIPTVELAADMFSQIVAFSAIAGIIFVAGKSIDAVHFKRAFQLKKYFLSSVFIFLSWVILEAGKNVFVSVFDLTLFLATLAVSFVIAVIAFRVARVFEVRKKITKLLIGLPVYSKQGRMLGNVDGIDKRKKIISYKDEKGKAVEVARGTFVLREGRIVIG